VFVSVVARRLHECFLQFDRLSKHDRRLLRTPI
jgi:hypothetical protein